MPIEVDGSTFPLVVVRFLGKFEDDEFDRYLADVEEYVRGDRVYAMVFDARQSGMPTSRQAREQARFLERVGPDMSRVSVGSVFVIASPVIRGAFKAITWMQSMPVDHTVVESIAQAEVWAREKLAARGVYVPDHISLTSADAAS